MSARILGILRELYLTNVLASTDKVVVYENRPDTGGNAMLYAETTNRGVLNFPYGYDVEPDAPV